VTYAALNMIKILWSERSHAMAFYSYRKMSDLGIIIAAIFTILPFLVAFAKLRKANFNFVISICPSVCSHPTDFHEITYLGIFR
jgi:heme/copper-type cytochrome/quinol oxidase subunit 4